MLFFLMNDQCNVQSHVSCMNIGVTTKMRLTKSVPLLSFILPGCPNYMAFPYILRGTRCCTLFNLPVGVRVRQQSIKNYKVFLA